MLLLLIILADSYPFFQLSHVAHPAITIYGRLESTFFISSTTVAGVRAVATVKRAPSLISLFSLAVVVSDNTDLLFSSVPSISLTYRVLLDFIFVVYLPVGMFLVPFFI